MASMLTIQQLVKKLQKHMAIDDNYIRSLKMETSIETKMVYLTVTYLVPASFAEDDN